MTNKLPIWALYLLFELGILGGWLINWLGPSPTFAVLTTTPALKALVLLEVAWLLLCVGHAVTTGSLTPVPPAMAAEGATADLHPGFMIASRSDVDGVEALIHDQGDRLTNLITSLVTHLNTPPQPPAPTLESFHQGEAGPQSEAVLTPAAPAS